MRNSSHESYNIRLKSDFSFLNNRVTVGESLILRMAEGKGGTDQDTMNGLLRFPSVIPIFDPENATGWGTSADINLPNPYAISEINDITSESTQIFLNAYLQAEIINGLKYKLNLGMRRNHTKTVIIQAYMTWGLMEPMKHRTFRKVFQASTHGYWKIR